MGWANQFVHWFLGGKGLSVLRLGKIEFTQIPLMGVSCKKNPHKVVCLRGFTSK